MIGDAPTQKTVALAIFKARARTYLKTSDLVSTWEAHALPKYPQGLTPKNTCAALISILTRSGHLEANPDVKGLYRYNANAPAELTSGRPKVPKAPAPPAEKKAKKAASKKRGKRSNGFGSPESKKKRDSKIRKGGVSGAGEAVSTDNGIKVNTNLFSMKCGELRGLVKQMSIHPKGLGSMKKEELCLILCGAPFEKSDKWHKEHTEQGNRKVSKKGQKFSSKVDARDRSTRNAGRGKNANKKNQQGNSAFLQLSTKANDQAAQTPEVLMKDLVERYGIDFDPCPPGGVNNVQVWNGLTGEWKQNNYVNPPYNKIKLWLAKAAEEQEKGKTSVFLIPFRIYTRYFGNYVQNISFVECLTKGVCFQGYKSAIPHPMSIITMLGKGVKETKKMHGIHTRTRNVYRMALDKPHTFDNACSIVRRAGLPKSKIHILVNHSKMGGLIDEENIEAAKKSWDNAFATLVPFYSYSRNFTTAMKEAQFVAFSSPILSNFEGEGKVRFCSVLFVFCPNDAKAKSMEVDKEANLGRVRVYFNDIKQRDPKEL